MHAYSSVWMFFSQDEHFNYRLEKKPKYLSRYMYVLRLLICYTPNKCCKVGAPAPPFQNPWYTHLIHTRTIMKILCISFSVLFNFSIDSQIFRDQNTLDEYSFVSRFIFRFFCVLSRGLPIWHSRKKKKNTLKMRDTLPWFINFPLSDSRKIYVISLLLN